MTDLLSTPYDRFGDALASIGVPRAVQAPVFRHLYGQLKGAMGDHPHIGKRHAAKVAQHIHPAVRLERSVPSPDGTEKLVVALNDGERVETVLMPLGKRTSVCVSSQVGCAMACGFCATGTLGLTRGLTAAEIVGQVRLARDRIAARGETFGSLVFMGMGEPLQHYATTRDALSILTDKRGPRVAPSRIRVSTVGLAPRIRQLGTDFGGQIGLALSLNAGTGQTRRRLMPISERYDLDDLKDAIRKYPLPGSNRYIMIEYVLLAGVTDTTEELDGLLAWMQGVDRAMVNLIPFNPFPGAPFESPETPAIRRAALHLRDAGIPVKVRQPRGRVAAAACGQLALRSSA